MSTDENAGDGRSHADATTSRFHRTGGLAALIRQHAVELAPHGIAVNGVAPTFVETALVREYLDDAGFRGELDRRIPLRRIAQPRDVRGPVTFFVSPAADYVTGQLQYVDGGITASQ